MKIRRSIGHAGLILFNLHAMKRFLRSIPVLGRMVRFFYRKWKKPCSTFSSSRDYWISRYESGYGSGDGSHGKLAEFKAEVLNSFVHENHIKNIIEYGCGDGNQLQLARYPSYLGFDVSAEAIRLCRRRFRRDTAKRFELVSDYRGCEAELTLSLDVIFHLVEDAIFFQYMDRLFESSNHYVIIYSSNMNNNDQSAPHVRHRRFTQWIDDHKPQWKLKQWITNKYPFSGDTKTGSLSDFFIYEKV